MKSLVTGGAGFIGSAFVRLTLGANPQQRLVNLDSLTYAGNLENVSSVEKHPSYSFVRADIRDAAAVEQACDALATSDPAASGQPTERQPFWLIVLSEEGA